jgi:hypothetical protein
MRKLCPVVTRLSGEESDEESDEERLSLSDLGLSVRLRGLGFYLTFVL